MDGKGLIFIGLGAIGAFFLFSSFKKEDKNMKKGQSDRDKPDGITFALFNMNPLNVKPSATRYPGEITAQGAIHRMFDSWTAGTAGGMIHLWRYLNGKIDGGVYPQFTKLDTIEKIVRTWAPANDGNDTEGYISYIVQKTGISRDKKIDWKRDNIIRLVKAMSPREDNNVAAKFVTDDVLNGAWEIASKYVLDMRFY
jgi:hypothetical protein